MKKLHCIALLCSIGTSTVGHAQTAQVQIAGSNYPVLFADTNLSSTVKQRIAADLKIIFSSASSFEDVKGGGGDEIKATTPLPGGGTAINEVFGNWEGVTKPNPEKAWFLTEKQHEGVFIVDYNNEKSVRLNEVASSNYLHAFAFVDARSNTVKKLREFWVTVRDTDWDTQPIKAVKALCYMKDPNGDPISDDDYRGFIKEMQETATPEFSVLWFSVEKRPEVGNKEVIVHGNLLLFHNGKWGFGNLPISGI